MRSVTSLAVLATSLLVKDVVAGRYDVRKRDYYLDVDEVIVTAEIIVTDMGGGVYATGGAAMVGTVTIDGTPVLVVETASSTSTSTTSTPEPVAASSTQQAAVFIEVASTPVAKTPTPSSTFVAPIPSTTAVAAVAAAAVPATTLIQVAAPAKTTASAIVVAATSATAATKSSTSYSSSAKRGVAYNDASLTKAFASSPLVNWAYNWGSSTSSISSTQEFIPMLWGLSTSDLSSWNTKATAAIASGSSHLLCFNEPDYSGQANLGYKDAAKGWLTYMEPFAGKAKLGSPAVTNGGDPMGLTWLANFVSECSTCTIDFVAIHWYNGGTAADFQAYIKKAYTAGGNRPLWITEFQASGSTSEQQAFLETMLPWLDASSMVDRYAYFMASDGNLISGTGLSALGSTYATYV